MRNKFLIIMFLTLAVGLGAGAARAALDLEVQVEGVGEEELANILAYLDIEQKREDPDLDQAWLKRLHAQAPEQIGEALQPFGHFSAEVESSLNEEGGGWVARYRVEPGPKTHVAEVLVQVTGEGAEELRIVEAIAAFPVKQGDVLDSDAYDSGKNQLLELITGLGYARAKSVVGQIRVNPKRNEARIRLEIETGPKYFMGPITLDQDVLEEEFLERYVHIQPGDVYSEARLLSLQSDLIATQYFSLVDVDPDFDQVEDLRVPVGVELQPANRHQLEFGLGYFTDIGVTGTVNWRFRPANRHGHFIDSQMRLSPVKSLIHFGYWIPVRDPRTDNMVLTAKLETEDSSSQDRTTAELRAGYYFLWGDWTTRLFGELKQETFTTGSQPETSTTIMSWGGALERTRVKEREPFPTRGDYWLLDLSGAAGVISDTAYLRGHLKTKQLFPLGERSRLNLRAELGLAEVGDFELYPSSLRYYAGGDQSVRGYEYQSLGPKDEGGSVVGGKNLFAGSIQYDYRLLDQWVVAAFVDAGNAFNDELDKFYYSGGVGVRWLSPFGPVRLDLGVPGNPDEGMDSWRIHFGFGAEL